MKINIFLKKHKEILLYLLFGAVTTAVSIFSFAFFEYLKIDALVANIFSWILSVFVAFITNSFWVFESDLKTEFVNKAFKFYTARLLTLLVEELLLLVFIKWLHFNSLLIKCIVQIAVIVLNYVISKLYVFSTNKKH
ncbi:MAG: GtrA family protein [Clostridia bacterium]|nr:GtrA family protein [Clostridia bacterium]